MTGRLVIGAALPAAWRKPPPPDPDGFDDAMKAMGLEGHHVDSPHPEEFDGKLSDGRRAGAEIFSRPQVPGRSRSMHSCAAS